MEPVKRFLLFLAFFSGFSVMVGCGGGGDGGGENPVAATTTPTPTPTTAVVYGTPVTTQVNVAENGVIQYNAAKVDFAFPNGGSGTLSITPAQSVTGFVPDENGTTMKVQYSGSGDVSIRVPGDSQTEASLFVLVNDGTTTRWWPLAPRTASDGYRYFDLSSASTILSPRISAQTTGSGNLTTGGAQVNLHVGEYTANQIALMNRVHDIISSATLLMTTEAGAHLRLWSNTRPLAFAWVNGDGSGSCLYDGFRIPVQLQVMNPVITLGRAQNFSSTLTHETGHYVMHLLFGNSAYYSLYQASDRGTHSVDMTTDRDRALGEAYAEYFCFPISEAIESTSPARPIGHGSFRLSANFFWSSAFSGQTVPIPQSRDMPSIESFGALLMAFCTSREPVVYDFNGTIASCPAIAATPGEVLSLLFTTHALRIANLYDALKVFAANRGNDGAMPVIAERIGWSYHGQGRVFNPDGSPAVYVKVLNISRAVNGVTYIAGESLTDIDGVFPISRLFPEDSELQLIPTYTASGSQATKTISIDPGTLTTKDQALGNFTLEPPVTKALTGITLNPANATVSVSSSFGLGSVVVTATYDDKSTAQVKNNVSWSGTGVSGFTFSNTNSPGTFQVTCSYTENNVTKTAPFSITVQATTTPTPTPTTTQTATTVAVSAALRPWVSDQDISLSVDGGPSVSIGPSATNGEWVSSGDVQMTKGKHTLTITFSRSSVWVPWPDYTPELYPTSTGKWQPRNPAFDWRVGTEIGSIDGNSSVPGVYREPPQGPLCTYTWTGLEIK